MDRYSKRTPEERFCEERSREHDTVPLVESKRTPGGIKEEPFKNSDPRRFPYGGGAAAGAQARTPTTRPSTDSSALTGTAVDIYDATIRRLNGNSGQGEKVAALVDFAKAVCPAMANGGRLAGLLRQYPAVQVLAAMWEVAPKKLAGDTLSYVQRTLEGRKQRDTAKAGRGAVRTEADLDDWERYRES